MSPNQPDIHSVPSERPLELRLLGAVDFRGPDADTDSVIAQPSRFALFVYLLLRRSGTFLRRDELLGVFWPESSQSRARGALRQATHFLRTKLGGDVIVGRGSGELGVAPEAVRCDALRFEQRLDEGDDRAALNQYGGVLLPGFQVSDVPEFERWVGRERRRFSREAVEAAVRLAERAEDEGDPPGAIRYLRRAMDIDPTREAVGRRLISLYDRVGDRASATDTYRRISRELRAELGVEPSPETVQLIESVRSRSTVASPAEREREAPYAEPDGRKILVVPLRNLTGDSDLDAVGRLVSGWISGRLASLPELAVVPPGFLPPGGGQEVESSISRARERAREVNARIIVSGAYHVEDDQLHFEIRLLDLAEETLVPGPEPLRVPRESPLAGLPELHDRLLTCLAPGLTSRPSHVLAGTRPPSYEAYQAYMAGLEAFIRGSWRESLDGFGRAMELEPEYPLPRVVSAIAHWNLSELTEAMSVAREAEALKGSLGQFERAVLDMVLAWLKGDWAAAHETALRQADLAPGSIPHFQVAEEARRLNRPREALDVLSGLDPESGELEGFLFYWIELATSRHLLGNHEAELEAARRSRRLYPDHPGTALLEIRALAALGRLESLEEVLDGILISSGTRRPWPGELLREAGLELRAHGHSTAASAVLDQATEWFDDRIDDHTAVVLRREFGRTLYAAERLERAESVFRELSAEAPLGVAPVGFHHGHLKAHLDEGYLAVISERRGDTVEADRIAGRLRSLDRPFSFGASWLWLAALAAVRDEKRQATSLLRRAFSEGLPHQMWLHTDPHLRLLRGDPIFEALMRPRG